METRKRRRSDRALRPPMRSPGRPPGWRREHRQQFWKAITRGSSSEAAAAEAGVSPAVGARWFCQGGGMPTLSPAPLSGRYLSFREREEIAILHAQDHSVREIARRLGRPPSTISRELRRNAVQQDSTYVLFVPTPVSRVSRVRLASRPGVQLGERRGVLPPWPLKRPR